MLKKKYAYYIGIDPGSHTGLGTWDTEDQKLIFCETFSIHRALEFVAQRWTVDRGHLLVRLEDARMVKFMTKKERAQGAGSVKRDVEIWIEFLEDYKIPYELVKPDKRMTKWPAPVFAHMTGWAKACSQHARDAAMLVYKIA